MGLFLVFTPHALNMAKLLFLWCAIVLTVSGQVYEFEPSYETHGFHNSSGNFSWRNCDNNTHYPLFFTVVEMLPDPLRLTGDDVKIKVSMDFNLTMKLGDHGDKIEVDLSLRMKTPDGYTEICGLVGESVCHYDDLCTVLQKLRKKHKVPWECPFEPQVFNLPNLTIRKIRPLPFLLKGTFEGTVFIKQQVNVCSEWRVTATTRGSGITDYTVIT